MQTQQQTHEINRRSFLKMAWGALGSLVMMEVGGITLAYMQPRLATGEFGSTITAGVVDDFPVGSVTHIPNGRFYLSRLPDGGFLALHQRCTHLGCNVPWDQNQNAFVCPCHNSRFSADGTLESPPAPRPLDTFLVSIQDGKISVDTSKPISRQAFEPNQVVYA